MKILIVNQVPDIASKRCVTDDVRWSRSDKCNAKQLRVSFEEMLVRSARHSVAVAAYRLDNGMSSTVAGSQNLPAR